MATEILVPPLGTNVDTVTLVTWYRREGDIVAAGEPLFAVETDKATLDVEAPAAGILRAVTAAEGDEVPALSRIAWIAGADELLPGAADAVPRQAGEAARATATLAPSPTATHPDGARRFASPWARTLAHRRGIEWTRLAGTGPMGAVVARDVEAAALAPAASGRPGATPLAARVARETGVDLAAVPGTGPGGRVRRDDVLRAAEAARIAAADIVETLSLTGVRGKIAERMHRGTTDTAPVTLTTEVDATRFVDLRRTLVAGGLRVTYNDLLMQIVARALAQHPRMNAAIEDGRIVVRRSAHIALAVDTERGLLAPVVRSVEQLSLAEIAAASSAVIARARAGQAAPEELRGSSFTITNLGMFGIDAFTPIINLPECAILGVGRIKPMPRVVEDRIEIRQALWLSLTFDHRLVDGGPAARFLQAIAKDIEAPADPAVQ